MFYLQFLCIEHLNEISEICLTPQNKKQSLSAPGNALQPDLNLHWSECHTMLETPRDCSRMSGLY